MELQHKTLYLLEELPPGRVHSSLLKAVASQDTISGRALYKGQTTVDVRGKLLINANAAPDLGEEGPVWDRAIFIPWDTRYVQEGEPVDPANYRMPSCNRKKEHLVSLADAFTTVCLKELHKFLNLPGNRDEDGQLLVTEIPQPACVRTLIMQEKEKGFPLKMFVKRCTRESPNAMDVTTTDLWDAYQDYIRHRNVRSRETQDDVMNKFPQVGLECKVGDDDKQYVADIVLTAETTERLLKKRERVGGDGMMVSWLADGHPSKRART